MYNNVTAPAMAGSSTGMLATTGTLAFWYFLAAFALIAVGTAIWRIVPRLNLDEPKDNVVSMDEFFNNR